MSELLKVYVQNANYIPIYQLSKLNINLLKTYYRNNEEYIKEQIFIRESYRYINTFYKVLDDNDKSTVLQYITVWSDIIIQNISDDVLKDFYLMFTDGVKLRLMRMDLTGKFSYYH